MKKAFALFMAIALCLSLMAGCGNAAASTPTANSEAAGSAAEQSTDTPPADDTVVLMLPPVTSTYQDQLETWAAEYKKENPHITLEFEVASWEDYSDKLSQQINAGSPPDIAFIGADGVGKYNSSDLMVDINEYITPEQRADFEASSLEFFTLGDALYGLPGYVEIQCLGGNRAMLEEAGADIEKIQTQGWTYEEFYKVVKAGTKADRYGFIFANAGVTATDMLSILSKDAGMPASFTKDMKYAYTSKNFLELLKTIRNMIDEKIMPGEAIQAGQRWNMFLTGQTMIFGKGLSTFEDMANANNAKVRANDGTAVEGSIEVEYVVLPVPTLDGCKQQAQATCDGYVMFRNTKEPSPEHMQNVMDVMYYMASGKVGAYVNNELCLTGVADSVKAELKNLTAAYERNPGNTAAKNYLIANAAQPRSDISIDLSAKAIRLQDEVMVPQFQALLANEVTPEQMYETLKSAAIDIFGADGIVVD